MLTESEVRATRHRPAASLGWRRAQLRRVARLLALALAFSAVCAQCAMVPAAAQMTAPVVAPAPHCHGDAQPLPSTVAPDAVVICDDCLDPMPALPSAAQHDAGDHACAHSFAVPPTHSVWLEHHLRVDTRAPPERRAPVSTPFTRRERLLI